LGLVEALTQAARGRAAATQYRIAGAEHRAQAVADRA
jgi:hypothetical protein